MVDGDTAVLMIDGRTTTVRLIGVDTPETVHPSKPVERFGKEASAFLKQVLDGKSVYLEYEEGASRLDKYGRTLAYLYAVPDARLVNLEIVAKGYGHAYTAYPFRYMESFREAERRAMEAQAGLWATEPAGAAGSPSGPATKPLAPRGPPAVEAEASPGKTAKPASETVYATRTGSKYHRAGCRYPAKSSIPMALAEASRKLGPCSVCDPPSASTGDVGSTTESLSTPSMTSSGSTTGICGATTKKVTPCQRRVAGGGRCYQHR